jgi:hypothetical protein
MAYSQNIIDAAFQYFCAGFSFDEVRDKVIADFPQCRKLALNTIKAWSRKFRWAKRRVEIQAQAEQVQNVQIAEGIGDVGTKLEGILGGIFDTLEAVKAENFSQAVNGLSIVLSAHRKVTGQDGSGEISDKHLRTFLETNRRVMEKIPAFKQLIIDGPIWNKYVQLMEAEFAQD